jgi:3-deoxy-D-manno-octulosonic-acid transferase
MLHQARRAGCHSLLANARLSERSARGYARVGGLTREMLATLDTVAAQSAADGERLVELGLQREKLHITGSIKFDLELGNRLQREVEALRLALGADRRHIVVVASTHPGEDEQVLAAFAMLRQNHPDCLLIIVPRHPERFDDVYRLCVSAHWQVCRRSSGELPGSDDDVLLGDTMGELLTLLGTATIAVIGGSLVEHGGHNALEASAWGVPVVTGPYMFNFTEISDLLTAAGAMIKLADPSELGASLDALLSEEQRRSAMGAAGREVVADNRGARQRLLALIDAAMQG